MPRGIEQHHDLERPEHARPPHQLADRFAREARLHEVPVTEEHGVGDHAEEGRADEQAGRLSA